MRAKIATWVVRLIGAEELRIMWTASALKCFDTNLEGLAKHVGKRLLEINTLKARIAGANVVLDAEQSGSLLARMAILEAATAKTQAIVDQELIFIQRFKDTQAQYERALSANASRDEMSNYWADLAETNRERVIVAEQEARMARSALKVAEQDRDTLQGAVAGDKSIEQVVEVIMDRWLSDRFNIRLTVKH